jgi:hypothetical protein
MGTLKGSGKFMQSRKLTMVLIEFLKFMNSTNSQVALIVFLAHIGSFVPAGENINRACIRHNLWKPCPAAG